MHDGNDDDDIDLEGDNNNDSFIITRNSVH